MRNNPVESILEHVQKIIVRQLGVEPDLVTPDARFREDLGADSIDLAELTMAFSSDFDGILDEDACQIQTVGDLVNYIERKRGLATAYAHSAQAPRENRGI